MDATCPNDVHKVIEAANGQPLDVYINSGGGDIFAGSEIYEALREYPGEVTIHVIFAASAASVIMCARKSVITPTGMVMVHNVSGSARGDYRQMDKSSEVLQQADRALAAAYTAKSGKPEAEVLAMMDRETWLTGQQAVDAGLVDAISQPARLTAAGPGTVPVEVLDRIRATVKGPQAQQRKDARSSLESLKLKGDTHMNKTEYQAKRAGLMTKAESLIDAGELDKFKAVEKEIEALDAKFDAEATAAANLRALADNPCVTDLSAHSVEIRGGEVFAAWNANGTEMEEQNMKKMQNAAEVRAFQKYIACGGDMRNMSADAQGYITTSGTGAVLPVDIFNRILTDEKYSDLLHRATTIVQAGAGTIKIPLASSNTATWKAEAEAVDPANPALTSIDLGGKELMRLVRYSAAVDSLSIDDFTGLLSSLVSSELVETLEDAFITGSTTAGQPHNGLDNLTWTDGKNLVEATGTISAADVAKGISMLKQKYARNVVLLMNANTAYNTVGLFKGTSEYAYNIADGASRFMGREIVINEHYSDDVIDIVDPKELYVRFAMQPLVEVDRSSGFDSATTAMRCLAVVDYAWNPAACVRVRKKPA